MKTGILARISCTVVLFFSTLGTVQAQQSFVVAGTVDLFINFLNPTQTAATFSATVHYDPDILLVNTLSSGMSEEVYFNEAVTQVEFAVYDEFGNQILSHVEEGISPDGKTTYIRALNGLFNSIDDELEYATYGESATHLAEAVIRFTESSGTLVNELTVIPEPPSLGDVDGTFVSLFLYEVDDSYNFINYALAEGTINMIDAGDTELDPFEECAEQAKNHGQYVSCVAHINNLLRADGEISGKEKGQRQQDAARSKK